jgi:hypothetical protein
LAAAIDSAAVEGTPEEIGEQFCAFAKLVPHLVEGFTGRCLV